MKILIDKLEHTTLENTPLNTLKKKERRLLFCQFKH